VKNVFFCLIVIVLIVSSGCSSQKMIASNKETGVQNNQIAGFNRRWDSLNLKVSDCNKQISLLENQNSLISFKAEQCDSERENVKSRMRDLSRTLQEQGDELQEIRKKALREFHSMDDKIEVKYRNGMVYISMNDQILFPSGSAKIKMYGGRCLSVIANILAEYPGVSAIIVGNTDSLATNGGYKDNWSLSTERANTIVRMLMNTYGSDPDRLTAAGKSKFHPVASNKTPEGRAKNRRIDIIINPDLSRLWQLSQKYP